MGYRTMRVSPELLGQVVEYLPSSVTITGSEKDENYVCLVMRSHIWDGGRAGEVKMLVSTTDNGFTVEIKEV